MQVVIYAGLRNGARNQQIHDALIYKRVIEVAREFQLSPGTIRAAEKRIPNTSVFELSLLGGQPDADRQGRGRFLPQGRTRRVPELPRHLSKP